MARHRKGGKRHTRRHRGGGAGIGGYSVGGPLTPGAPIGNTSVIQPMESCLATARPGMVSFPTSGLGLPGMSGGGRRRRSRRGSRRGSRRIQRGGRYSFSFDPLTGAAPWAGAGPQAVRIPCEGSTPNPLNPGPHTPSTQPPIQAGGAGGIDSAYYAAPTAGYGNTPSSWVGSTGAPVMLQAPYDARSMNPACLKTGGGRRRRRATRRKGRK